MSGDDVSQDDAALVSIVRQAPAYGAIVNLGEQTRLSVKIGEPIWARVNNESLCTPDAIDLDTTPMTLSGRTVAALSRVAARFITADRRYCGAFPVSRSASRLALEKMQVIGPKTYFRAPQLRPPSPERAPFANSETTGHTC